MDHLPATLRRELERAVVAAHVHAQQGAVSALKRWGVDAAEPHQHFTEADKDFRRKLRARARLLGDNTRPDGTHAICRVGETLAYEYWHRMLFARFLAENGLLLHPDGVAVSLEECDELAPDADPPAANGFVLAARYASHMLPQIFRTDDVLLDIEFAPEHRLALERILTGLPREVFRASESIGWSYQFWQSRQKDEINKSGVKIDGSTVAPVTQLFTETYMVEFLLHNTIGAWWCARNGVAGPPGGAGTESLDVPVAFKYLRWGPDGHPAAGRFEGWPPTARLFTLLDPCCGSYHFLVTAFKILVGLRVHEEGLTAAQAMDAVLTENLHGLDIDPCCSKLAAFSLAFVAWTYRDESGEMLGYRPLPPLSIACTGQPLDQGQKADWLKFANGDAELRAQIGDLFETFEHCYHVGSLINPVRNNGSLFCTGSAEITRKLTAQLAKYRHDAEASAIGVAAQGMAKAAELLSGSYTLVATNVPYLGRGKQADVIQAYIHEYYPLGKADLATAFVLRCLELCTAGGSTALVTPQNWLFLTSYKKLREELLKRRQWNLVARLGPRAFETIGGEVVNVALLAISAVKPADAHRMAGLDVAEARTPTDKADRLADRLPTPVQVVEQAGQLRNTENRIAFTTDQGETTLADYAIFANGLQTGDYPQYIFRHWEMPEQFSHLQRFQSTVGETTLFSGCDQFIKSDETGSNISDGQLGAVIRGAAAWARVGVAVSAMNDLKVAIYQGVKYDDNTVAIIPKNEDDHAAIWCCCSHHSYAKSVREIDKALKVRRALIAIPFDLAHWQAVATEKYPNGLPEPHSDDPTQWLFRGDIATSTDPLQVAVARLLGYRWPDQPKEDAVVDPFVDDDGIVCLPGVKSEPPAAERLADLLRAVGVKTEVDLAAWLRDSFFAEHCKRFHQRPFIWHVWDGRKDGFAALVNAHKLTHKTLENLTYSYLGDWIAAQSKSDKVGADLRLAAAQALQAELKLILAGEPPYDIFVRWKPLCEQAIGWHPDLNDGVRMNIRPFVAADILRKTPNVKWAKDRGKEPARDSADYPWFNAGGDRVNDIHLTNAEKQAARDKMKAKGATP